MKIEKKSITKVKNIPAHDLFNELSQLIEQSRTEVAVYANSSLTMLFWQVGRRINEHVLKNKRAEYGKQIVPTLSAQLESAYGQNFTEKNVRRMMRFAEQFSQIDIVVPMARQLSWSHFVEFLPVKNPEAKLFYGQLAIEQRWSVREMRTKIETKTFERTEIATIKSLGLAIFH